MAEKRAGNGRYLRWALGLSLGVNLLVLGLVAGAAYRFDGPGGGAFGNMRSYGAPYIMALPEDARRAMFRDLRRDRQDRSVSRAEHRAQYDEALDILRSDAFDPARLSAVLGDQRAVALDVQETVEQAWLAEISQMDADARAAYADQLQEVLEKGPKRGRGKGKGDRSGDR